MNLGSQFQRGLRAWLQKAKKDPTTAIFPFIPGAILTCALFPVRFALTNPTSPIKKDDRSDFEFAKDTATSLAYTDHWLRRRLTNSWPRMFPHFQEKIGGPKLDQVCDHHHGYGQHPDFAEQNSCHGVGATVETVYLKEGSLTPEARRLFHGEDKPTHAAPPLVYVNDHGDMAAFRDIQQDRPDLRTELVMHEAYIDALRQGLPTTDHVRFAGSWDAHHRGRLPDYVGVSHKHEVQADSLPSAYSDKARSAKHGPGPSIAPPVGRMVAT